jgi:hypothetical protein
LLSLFCLDQEQQYGIMTPGLFYMKFDLELNTKVEENSNKFPTVLYMPSNR